MVLGVFGKAKKKLKKAASSEPAILLVTTHMHTRTHDLPACQKEGHTPWCILQCILYVIEM